MFTQENLTKIFKGKQFGYGKWHLYFHSKENDYECGVLGRGPQIILKDEKAVCELYTS